MRNAEGENKTRLLYKPIVHILLIVATGLIAYSNTFNVPFQFDDYTYIIDNHKLRNLSNFWPPTGSRWTGLLTFALNYKFGGLSVTDYHIVNIIIHIINALLVYRLVLLTFKTPFLRKDSGRGVKGQRDKVAEEQDSLSTVNGQQSTNLIALFSSLLFISHPVQTQAVTYIVQRFTSLATMFYLLSLVLFVKWRLKAEQQSNSTAEQQVNKTILAQLRGRTSAPLLYCAGLLSAVLAMKTKEIAFTLPIIIVLYEFFFFSKSQNSEPSGSMQNPPIPPLTKGGKGGFLRITRHVSRFLYLLPFFLTLIIIPLNFIGYDWEIYKPVPDAEEKLRQLQLKDLAALSKYEYLQTQFRVIVTYIRLLFLPVNQNLDYDYPIYNSFLNPNVFL
ncbi:MAG: hypothetical protein HY759_04300, partial [Nitrospirae bacterium]|nr:hypothetical protein [Nitrospirota bacterium]